MICRAAKRGTPDAIAAALPHPHSVVRVRLRPSVADRKQQRPPACAVRLHSLTTAERERRHPTKALPSRCRSAHDRVGNGAALARVAILAVSKAKGPASPGDVVRLAARGEMSRVTASQA